MKFPYGIFDFYNSMIKFFSSFPESFESMRF